MSGDGRDVVSEKKESCANCRYGRPAATPPGPIVDITAPKAIECHGTAPSVLMAVGADGQPVTTSLWPTIVATQWCGLWAESHEATVCDCEPGRCADPSSSICRAMAPGAPGGKA